MPTVTDDAGRRLVREFRGAAALTAAASEPDRLSQNVAFVAPGGDAAERGNGGPQVVRRRVLVVIALYDPSDRLGADGLTTLERAVEAICGALIGWHPPGAAAPAIYLRGELFAFARASIWWQMQFEAPTIVRGAPA